MRLLDNFCNTEFNSYEDFYENLKINAPDNFNFAYDIIDEYARLDPGKTALIWANDKGEDKILTFGEISELSKKAAAAFMSLGIKQGDRVILMLKRRYQFWYLMPALCRIGATAIPATHLLTKKDIVYRVKMAGAKMIIGAEDEEFIASVKDAQKEIDSPLIKATISGKAAGFADFDELVEKSAPLEERISVNPEKLMLIYFTSGTTGMPKMVVHNYFYPLGHILTGCFWHNLKDTDIHFTLADTGWAKCSWGKMYGQWIAGAAVFVYDYETRFLPIEMAKMIEKYKITTFCAPPTVFRFLIKEDLSGIDLSSLRDTFIAGEPLNPEVYKQWYKLTGLMLREGYGQTETAVLAASFPWIEPKPGSMGKPSPVFNIRLLDVNGDFCEVGEEGEICIDMRSGPPYGLFLGYLDDESKTSEAMRDGWYHTGDMAWYDEDGYYWFVGRGDDVIKSSGYRIGPFEVESALLEHAAVLETAITAVPDPVRGQVVKATIVLAKGYEPLDGLVKELQDHVKRVTAPYKYPRIIEFVKELPKTVSGKIKRAEIRNSDKKS